MKIRNAVSERTKFRLLSSSCILALYFQLVTLTSSAQYTKLLDFAGTANGTYPFGSLISDGTFLYGMTYWGGTNDEGTIFKILPDGTGYAKLLDFAGAANGSEPRGSLISDGTFLYGMTSRGGTSGLGTIFKIMPNGTGFAKLLDFNGAANGRIPYGSLISDGTFLYGMTALGGTNNFGTTFKIMPDGTGYAKLLDFDGAANGSDPLSSLISDGAFLYGMTQQGGINDLGTIFRIMPDGTGYTKLLDFDGATNGSYPEGSLISDGVFLYGLTASGGTNDLGTVFKYSIAPASCVPASQRNALIALYNSTDGANWTNTLANNANWTGADESTWFGVTVTGCNVTNIVLNNNNLTGSLPTEIGDLPGLVELKLSYNHLNGNLPSGITDLTNLEILLLDNNVTLSGPLPPTIGNLVSLREINTQGNVFTGDIPSSMANCLALENIHLEGNQHTGTIPAYFSTFPNLYSINLAFNQFSGSIPIEWGLIPNLNYLSLASNNLTGSIPTELGSLGNLTIMDLSRNQLSGSIPISFGSSMTSLYNLQLWSNQLTGALPDELGNIISLQYVNLSDNLLSGSIPTTLVGLPVLSFLELQNNQLTGTIPTMATSIVFLRLS